MSGYVEQVKNDPWCPSIPLTWFGFFILAIVELLIVSARFDSGVLVEGKGLVRFFAEHLPLVPQFAAVACAGTLVFGGKELADFWTKAAGRPRGISVFVLLTTHLTLFSLFMLASVHYFEIDRGASSSGFAVWGILAIATSASWLALVVDPLIWLSLLKELSGPILIGSIVGALALFAGQWAVQTWEFLAFATFQMVALILTLFCVGVYQDPAVRTIGTAEFSVTIAPECSGYEGMGLAVVFVTTYLWWKRKEHLFPRSFLLIPASILLMFVVNAIRIATLVLLGHFGAREIAAGGFHSQAGWIGFNLVALGLVAFARTSPLFSRREFLEKALDTGVASENRAFPMLAPFVFLTLSIMLLGAVQAGFDWLYPLRFLVVVIALGICFKQYPRDYWTPSFNWTAVTVGAVVYLIWNFLESPDDGVARALYDTARVQSPLIFAFWLVFRVLGSVVTVPIAEEFAFRGYLLPWLAGEKSQRWSWIALIVSSLAFGVLHPGRWLAGTVAGALYGIAYYRSGRVMDAVLAHATTNALIAAEAVLWSRWYLWG